MTQTLETLLAKQDIYELCCLYMRGLDRLDKPLLLDLFWEDGWCEYGIHNSEPASFIDFAIGALNDHASNQHMIGNLLIDIEGNEAFGELYFRAYHKVPNDNGADDVIIAGRYLDRYEQRDGVWKFAYRSEVVDWSRTEPTSDSYFDLAPNGLRGSRSDDAVYQRANRYRPL